MAAKHEGPPVWESAGASDTDLLGRLIGPEDNPNPHDNQPRMTAYTIDDKLMVVEVAYG